jgi:2-polyprenyl-3-methyl-5-hydroxy-6-metoxy-1,4-benzoquinol methylase
MVKSNIYKSNPYPHEFIKIYDFSIKWIIDKIPLGSRIIDIGCGDGYLTRIVKKKCCPSEIIGIDKEKKFIDEAFARDSDNISFLNFDGESQEKLLKLGQFDVILLRNTFHHFLNKREMLVFFKEKLLRGKGKLLIIDLDSKSNFDYLGLGAYITLFNSLRHIKFSIFLNILLKTKFLLKNDIISHRGKDKELLKEQKWLYLADILHNFHDVFLDDFYFFKQTIFLSFGGLYFFEYQKINQVYE